MPSPDIDVKDVITQILGVGSMPKLVRMVLLAHAVELGDSREAWAREVTVGDIEIGEYGTVMHVDAVTHRVVRMLLGGKAASA